MNKKRNILYIQSGGPTSVINAELYGVWLEAMAHRDVFPHIYGSLYGVEGLINDELIDLVEEDYDELTLLPQTTGAILGSSRKKLPDIEDPLFETIMTTIHRHNIGYIIFNGGNDSMDSCAKLADYFLSKNEDIKCIGLAKTIDNDLCLTDHSIGFISAALHVINAIKATVLDARCFKRGKVAMVEIMGRNAGWLTAASDVLEKEFRPDLFYLPETPFDEAKFLDDVERVYRKKGYAVVLVSEGINAKRISTISEADEFGHVALEGVGNYLASRLFAEKKISCRSFSLSVLQRADPLLISSVEQEEAINSGKKAVRALLSGETGKMVAIKRICSSPYLYKCELVDTHGVANAVSTVPLEWIDGNRGMKQEFRDYLNPLLSNPVLPKFKCGVVESCHLRKRLVK